MNVSVVMCLVWFGITNEKLYESRYKFLLVLDLERNEKKCFFYEFGMEKH